MRIADPVTRELLWSGFQTVVSEMSVVLQRSAFSPMIREMLDFSCGLLDPEGRLIADSNLIPAQAGTLEFALQGALQRIGRVSEGDVFVSNDPYSGATHLPDIEIFCPVFADGILLGFVATVAHHVDIGGLAAGNRGALETERMHRRDLFEEGLQIPPVKLVAAGEDNAALWQVILRNVRDPASVRADITAQISSCRRGAERLTDLARKYSARSIIDAYGDLIDETSARTAALLRSWPGGAVTVTASLDGDGLNFSTPVRIEAEVRVSEDRLVVDLTRSSPQLPGTYNVPLSSTYSGVYYALRCFLGPTIRQNHGYMRHVEVIAEQGSVFNPERPAAVLSRHMPVQALTDAVFRALGALMPRRSVASSHISFPVLLARATDPRTGATKTLMDTVGGGGGARRDAPGQDGIDTYTSNCALISAEVIEIEYPWRVLRCELVDGSAGTGRQPGGRAVRRDYELLAEHASGRISAEQRLPAHAPRGVEGGGDGAPAAVRVQQAGEEEWHDLPFGVTSFELSAGGVVSLTAAGGGGFGTLEGGPH